MKHDFTELTKTLSLLKELKMKNVMHGAEVLLNKVIACDYAGKARLGKVIQANTEFIRIEYDANGKKEYRCLSHDKIENMRVEGYTL